MSFHRILLAAFMALPLAACNFSLDESPVSVGPDQDAGDNDTEGSRQPAGVTRVDVRSIPALWGQVSAQGLSAAPLGLTENEELVPLRTVVTEDGLVHTRSQQTYQGIPVWGERLLTAADAEGQIVRMHGNLIQGLGNAKLDSEPAFGPEQVLVDMKALHNASLGGVPMEYKNESSELVIYLHDGQPVLSYAVSFFADSVDGGKPTRPTFLVDAKSGDILFQFEGLTTNLIGTGPGGNQKTGQYEYGTDYGYNDVAVSGSTCTMTNANVKTVNLNHGTSGSTAFSYTCPRNTVKTINGAYSPLNDAHYFGGVIYNMYQAWIGVPPLSFQLTMRVHYSNSYENAFWDGSAMTFGDGASYFYPLVALDVAAHEVSHGFTEQNSGLLMSGEAGAINESFSDMAGEAAEYFMKGINDWLVGADVFKGSGALRYMCNPTQDGSSINNAADYYSGMDPHYASGVYNKAFCLLAKTAGWDTHKAFQIFAKANQLYWTPNATFVTACVGVHDAAGDLGFNTADVDAAFAAVGVGPCDVNDAPPPPLGNELFNGDTETNLGTTTGNWIHYFINVPSRAHNLTFTISGGAGDADLYVKLGSQPTTSSYDCRPYIGGNNETCSFATPSMGTYYVSLRAYSTFSGVSLSVSYDLGSELFNGDVETNLSESTVGNWIDFFIVVPDGASNLKFTISGGTGDADLYVKLGSQPTTTSYDCRPYIGGNNEICSFATPSMGIYYVSLRAYTAFSGVSLSVTYDFLDELYDGVALANISASTGDWFDYHINVPPGATNLSVTLSGNSGDADLYVKFGSMPTAIDYDCRPYRANSNEACNFASPPSGIWYVSIYAFTDYTNVSVIGDYQ